MAFCVIREGYASCQVVLFVGDNISKGMVDYVAKLPKESIVEIVAKPCKPSAPVDGCSQQVELQTIEFWCVNKSVPMLPFQIEDASRKVLDQAAEDGKHEGKKEETVEESKEQKQAVVKQDVRLNNRVIDLRVPTNQAIFKLQSGVCLLYREFMIKNDFMEIHSPKLIGGSSEGGANVFKFKYFE